MGVDGLDADATAPEATPSSGSAGTSLAHLRASLRESLVELLPPEYTRSASLVWFHAAVVPKALGGELLKVLQAHAPLGPEYLHLKRVRASPAPAPAGSLQVLVCSGTVELPWQVVDFLRAKDCGSCVLVEVPRDGALTRKQLADFSLHWPLTFRKPSFEPLELNASVRAEYANWLDRATEVGGDKCGCIVLDKSGREIVATVDETHVHPLRHAVMVAIEKVAEANSLALAEEGQRGLKRPRADEDYLCQECEVITSHEPCVMCAMALVHSRVRLVAYDMPDPHFGGLGGKIALHTCPNLNHQIRVLRWPSGLPSACGPAS